MTSDAVLDLRFELVGVHLMGMHAADAVDVLHAWRAGWRWQIAIYGAQRAERELCLLTAITGLLATEEN